MAEEEKVVKTMEETVVSEESTIPANESHRTPRGKRFGKSQDRNTRRSRGPRKEEKQYEERVVSINRVSRTVKGGRKLRFAALVVVGDQKGNFGYGTGKAIEVPEAIKKALENAKRNMFHVTLVKNGTISHDVYGKYGACKVYLKPAPEGTGIIAGGPVRAILELAGVKNIYSKVYGSRTPINCIRATIDGLSNIKTYSQVQLLRKGGKTE